MDDKTLNKWLDTHQAPTPSAELGVNILAAASVKDIPANQNQTFRKRFMPIAATILAISMVGFTGFTILSGKAVETTETETALWQEAALDLGFDDIYNWVESEDTSAQ